MLKNEIDSPNYFYLNAIYIFMKHQEQRMTDPDQSIIWVNTRFVEKLNTNLDWKGSDTWWRPVLDGPPLEREAFQPAPVLSESDPTKMEQEDTLCRTAQPETTPQTQKYPNIIQIWSKMSNFYLKKSDLLEEIEVWMFSWWVTHLITPNKKETGSVIQNLSRDNVQGQQFTPGVMQKLHLVTDLQSKKNSNKQNH